MFTPPVLAAMGSWLLDGYYRIAKGAAGVNRVRLWTLSLLFNLVPPLWCFRWPTVGIFPAGFPPAVWNGRGRQAGP